jgi:hypothetical protein
LHSFICAALEAAELSFHTQTQQSFRGLSLSPFAKLQREVQTNFCVLFLHSFRGGRQVEAIDCRNKNFIHVAACSLKIAIGNKKKYLNVAKLFHLMLTLVLYFFFVILFAWHEKIKENLLMQCMKKPFEFFIFLRLITTRLQ